MTPNLIFISGAPHGTELEEFPIRPIEPNYEDVQKEGGNLTTSIVAYTHLHEAWMKRQ